MEINQLTHQIIGCAIEVHRMLGPGLLESAYQETLAFELAKKGLTFRKECPVPICYKDMKLDCAYRLDFLIENRVIIELKAVEILLPIHEAQLLTYMKFAEIHIGLLINFNCTKLIDGLRRFIL